MKKSQRSVKFTVAEKEALKTFFDFFTDEISNATCNDFEVKNTPGNREMLQAAIRHCYSKAEQVDALEDLESQEGKDLNAYDIDVWNYLRWKIEKIVK